jgi:hypothetical protein
VALDPPSKALGGGFGATTPKGQRAEDDTKRTAREAQAVWCQSAG